MAKIGRKGAEWARVSASVLAGATQCAMPNCKYPGKPLDSSDKIVSRHKSGWRPGPLYPTVDHLIPVSLTEGWSDEEKRRALHDPRYLRPAHMGCNGARGNRSDRHRPRALPTRDWGV